MPQFIAFFVSLMLSVGVAHTLDTSGTSHHVKIHMPRKPVAVHAGVSGGGPVGTEPNPMPTPPSSTGH